MKENMKEAWERRWEAWAARSVCPSVCEVPLASLTKPFEPCLIGHNVVH